ncbi:MAG: hypothetical protein JW920_08870 [Deltaproteobacteria bacterium]|nr:hypothetical protein [Deltaproteobacteria bacterium]
MKKIFLYSFIMFSLVILPGYANAASSLQVVAEDTLWGAAIGTLVGAATLAFTDDVGDHLDRIAKGASIGLVGGLAFGLYEISPILFTYQNPANHERVYGLGVMIPLK